MARCFLKSGYNRSIFDAAKLFLGNLSSGVR